MISLAQYLHSLPVAELEFAWRFLVAAVLGSLVGLERSVAGKHAGMRTYALVSLGACAFTAAGTLASLELSVFSGINPLQIAGSIVIGIGFIGSGIAAYRSENHVELTTAAGIWVVASIGMLAGFGLYVLAVAMTVLAVATLSLLLPLENAVRRRFGVEEE